MSKVFIQEDTLTNIANAIREKDGTTDPIAPQNMADAIINLPSGEEIEPIVLTGNCNEFFMTKGGALLLDVVGNKITTADITGTQQMFYGNDCEEIPFEINFSVSNTDSINSTEMFMLCKNLKIPPKLNNYQNKNSQRMFSACRNIREFPEDYFNNWVWPSQKNYFYTAKMFSGCYSLRTLPTSLIKNFWGINSDRYNPHYEGFYSCYCLDEIKGLVVSTGTFTTYNNYGGTATMCYRLKSLTFETNLDGTPKTANWKNQTIYLPSVGYVGSNINTIIGYNSGITADKEVKDDTTYQALKNDPDWFSLKVEYSRYNHDSAVETINSLPDTSVYLASNGGSNAITFLGTAGALTDGGAINTLTEEEIAVATAKGWTVSFI